MPISIAKWKITDGNLSYVNLLFITDDTCGMLLHTFAYKSTLNHKEQQ